MSSIIGDVKGMFNSFIAEQRKQPSKTVLDVDQFSNRSTQIVRSIDLATFDVHLMRAYRCSGCAALTDAICEAINEIGL